MPDVELPITLAYWEVDLGGESPTLVQSIDGLTWSVQTNEYRSIDAQGNPVLVKVPGNLAQGGTMTLSRAVDSNKSLWDWFHETHLAGNDPGSAKRDIVLTMKDQGGVVVAVYNAMGCYPSAYDPAAFNAEANEVAMESMTIEYEIAEVVP